MTTQGRPVDPVNMRYEWVTEYKVTYSADRQIWTDLPDVYVGNFNRNDKKTNRLPADFETRYIGLRVVEYYGHISLRWDVTGCVAYGKIPLYTFLTLMAARNISVREGTLFCKLLLLCTI